MSIDSSPVPEIKYTDLEFYERLSAGSYGTVYRAKLVPLNKIVAVKKVLVLEKEAQVLAMIRHKNIIRFYGAVTEPPNFCIILEFACNGSLYSYLHGNIESEDSDSGYNFDVILRWALDIASAVNYLHNEAPTKIVHRDLKSNNIVIDEGYVCKLCDFGTSKALLHTTKMTAVGTVAWMSPELIQNMPASEATDTWSYGVVLWELLTRQVPFKGFEFFRIAWMVVEENERLCIPSSCPPELSSFLERCWSKDPKCRPLFPDIIKFLNDLACNKETSQCTEQFLTQKNAWLTEIEDHVNQLHEKEHELSQREQKLKNWEQLLTRREKNIANSRRLSASQQQQQKLVSNDVGLWDENDVADWFHKFLSSGESDFFGQSSLMRNRVRDNRINGSRLRLLTDNDLRHIGLSNAVRRRQLLNEISHLLETTNSDKELSDFVDVLDNNFEQGSNEEPLELNLTFLTGFYIRECINAETHRWKCFLDIDDIVEYENGLGFIQRVIFWCSKNPQWKYEIEKAPYIIPEWITGFSEYSKHISCRVEFVSGIVFEPDHVSIPINIDPGRKGCLQEQLVQVKVRSVAGSKRPFSRRRMHLPLLLNNSDTQNLGSPSKTKHNFNRSLFLDARKSHQIHAESPNGDVTVDSRAASDSAGHFESSFSRNFGENTNKASSVRRDSVTNARSRLIARTASDESNKTCAESFKAELRQRPLKSDSTTHHVPPFFSTHTPKSPNTRISILDRVGSAEEEQSLPSDDIFKRDFGILDSGKRSNKHEASALLMGATECLTSGACGNSSKRYFDLESKFGRFGLPSGRY